MEIRVDADVKQLTRHLNRIQKKQIPFATSKALNTLAFDVKNTLETVMPQVFDRPTPYVAKRGIQVKKSTKKDLVAEVGFRSKAFGKGQGDITPAEIMEKHILGGTRFPRKRAIPVPTKHIKLNRYGNLARTKINKLLENKDRYFSGAPKGMPDSPGIWERMPINSKRKNNKGGKIRMLIGYEPKAEYSKRFNFKSIVTNTIRTNFKKRFNYSIQKALESAR